VCAVNLSEVLVGPTGSGAEDAVDLMRVRAGIRVVDVDLAPATRAASVRAGTGPRLPDAYAVATALHGAHLGWAEVRLATFDATVRRAAQAPGVRPTP
jgi:predicted nucleic acid-binding protein